jgi:hypothetical protein
VTRACTQTVGDRRRVGARVGRLGWTDVIGDSEHHALRLSFLALYPIGVIVLIPRGLAARVPLRSRRTARRRINLYLPFFLLPVGFLIPPATVLRRAGGAHAG